MLKKIIIVLIVLFVFSVSSVGAFQIFAPDRVEFFADKNKLTATLKIWNDQKEPVTCGVKLTPQVVDVNGRRIEAEGEKKFCEAITISDLIFLLPAFNPSNNPFTLRLSLNLKKMGEELKKDHYATIYIYELPQKIKAEQSGAINLQSEGFPILFFANPTITMRDKGKAKIETDSAGKKRILVEKNDTSIVLFGTVLIFEVKEDGSEKLLFKDTTFRVITNGRYINLPKLDDVKKIRVEFRGMYPPHPIIINQTLSLASYREGFFPLVANRNMFSEMFNVLIKDKQTASEKMEILADIRDVSKALEFQFTEKGGIIKGNTFGKKEWYVVDVTQNIATNYNTATFKITPHQHYFFDFADLSKIFGIKIAYDTQEAMIRIRGPGGKKFIFELKEKLAEKIERSENDESAQHSESVNWGNSKSSAIFALKSDYSLSNSHRMRENVSSANFNFGINFSDFLFTANQKVSSDGSPAKLERRMVSYYSLPFKLKFNLGEIYNFPEDPFGRSYAHGKGIEISTLQFDENFPFPAKNLLPANTGNKDVISEAYFINGKYIDPNSSGDILLSKGYNPITRQSITTYGDEILERQSKIIPRFYPGNNKFSFYAGILETNDEKKLLHNLKLNYGLRGKLFTLGKMEQFYLSSEYPCENFTLNGLAIFNNRPQYNFCFSTVNFQPSIRLNLFREENTNISLSSYGESKGISLSGNLYFYTMDGKWENEERISCGYSPLRIVSCSIGATMKDDKILETNLRMIFRHRDHRFEISARKFFYSEQEYIPFVGYDYSRGKFNFSFYGYGESLNSISFNISYSFENFGRVSQSVQYEVESNSLSANTRYSGSLIAADNHFNFLAESVIYQAKIIGHVFLDRNYNGTFETVIDENLENVKLTVDGKPIRYATLKNGNVWMPIAVPKKVEIGVDVETLPIQATPDNPVLVNIAYPATIKVEIPIYLTGKIMGTDNGNAVKIQLVRKKTEEIIAESDVLTDGTFYFNKVIPGDYILIAGNRKKEVTIKIDEQGEPISVLDIIIEK